MKMSLLFFMVMLIFAGCSSADKQRMASALGTALSRMGSSMAQASQQTQFYTPPQETVTVYTPQTPLRFRCHPSGLGDTICDES